MKKIIIPNENQPNVVELADVPLSRPIFAKHNGKLAGMLVCEEKGWVLRIGGSCGAYKHNASLEETIRAGEDYGYEFYVER